jgi:DNA-directed RNA polymerase subunit M
MEFCPECGSIIQPDEQDGQTVLDCDNCDYTGSTDNKVEFSEKSESKNDVEVVEEGANDTKPVVEKECPECGNDEAKFWTVQTRAGDEPETRFYECTDCGHTWREY